MKKLSIVALALGLLTITACNNKKEEAKAPAKAEVEVITDSAFQEKVAGEYKSLDQQTVITLNRLCKGLQQGVLQVGLRDKA